MLEIILILCIYLLFLYIIFLSIILMIWGAFGTFFFSVLLWKKKVSFEFKYQNGQKWRPENIPHPSPMASTSWFVQKFFFMMVKRRANKMLKRGKAGLLSNSWIEIVIFSRILFNVLICLNYASYTFSWDVTNVFSPVSLSLLCVWNYLSAAAAAATAASLQSCPTLCNPIDGSPPGFPSLGFSRQEHWSGLPFPSPMHESEKWKWSRSVVSNSSDPMDCSLPGSSVHGIF